MIVATVDAVRPLTSTAHQFRKLITVRVWPVSFATVLSLRLRAMQAGVIFERARGPRPFHRDVHNYGVHRRAQGGPGGPAPHAGSRRGRTRDKLGNEDRSN